MLTYEDLKVLKNTVNSLKSKFSPLRDVLSRQTSAEKGRAEKEGR